MNTGALIDQPGLEVERFEFPRPPQNRPLTTSLAAASQQPSVWSHFAQFVLPPPRTGLFPASEIPFQAAAGVPLHEGFAHALRSLNVSGHSRLSSRMCQRLVELLALQQGWDGENAKPLKPEEVAVTVGLLITLSSTLPKFIEPFVVPTISGFAQLEWHNERRILEFEGTPSGWAIVGSEVTSRGERVYHEADVSRSSIEELVEAYRWFDEMHLVWPII